jgi:hypothetical protein
VQKHADDDNWLHLTPASLEALLKKADGVQEAAASEGDNTNDNAELSAMATKIESFLSKESDYTGAEVENETVQAATVATSKEKVVAEDGPAEEAEEVTLDWERVLALVSPANSNSSSSNRPVAPKVPGGKNTDRNSDQKTKQFVFETGPDSDDEDVEEEEVASTTDELMVRYMQELDAELALNDTQRLSKVAHHTQQQSSESMALNVNLVENLLQAYSSQSGRAGPASSLLTSLGITLPDDTGE